MNVLVISRKERVPLVDELWSELGRYCDVTVVKLTKYEIRNFREYINSQCFDEYDRIILDAPLRRIGKNYPALKKLNGFVYYEEDSNQNFLPDSKYYKKYDVIYRDIGTMRLLGTGMYSINRYREKGIDCFFLPKAYNPKLIHNMKLDQRDIELGYIGRIKNRIYKGRRKLLFALRDLEGLQILRTEPDEAYCKMLNRIKIFVSADIGLNEYNFKNFEAMAAGCVVVAERQVEDLELLGFKDMENIVLYSDLEEAREKIKTLKSDEMLCKKIAESGQALVEERHAFVHRGKLLYDGLLPEIAKAPPAALIEKIMRLTILDKRLFLGYLNSHS